MCGICGVMYFQPQTPQPAMLEKMVEKLHQRGPDGGGIEIDGQLGLGHRRLKVIDLSENGHQPMQDDALGLTIVFNGCIYNYQALRQSLLELGYSFFSTSDTEVILKAYHAWGWQCVQRFNGMFAFAIYERQSGRVVLARDRLGIKPLYIHQDKSHLRFASSIPSLLAGGGITTTLDPIALHHFLSFHSVVPAPRTLLQQVQKLPPATVRIVEKNGSETNHTYWNLQMGPQAGDAERTEAEWQQLLDQALRAAVSRRLVADVPVGLLLSGGLDSSLMAGLLVESGQLSRGGLSTFSIGFEQAGGEEGDEFQYSDIVAAHFGTDHHKIFIETNNLPELLRETVRAMSEPMVSHDAVGFYLLSREVAKHVKVVQSGQGADEVFAGYHWYPKVDAGQDAFQDYRKAFFDRSHEECCEMVHRDIAAAWQQDYSSAFVESWFAHPHSGTAAVDKALHLDQNIMLVDDPVKRVDNMTMAWGLEARVPFLDHELVELAARIPGHLKLQQGGKGILKEVARPIIPHAVIDRAKGYFPVPALKHMDGPVLKLAKEVLTSPRATQRGLIQPSYINRLLDHPTQHITPLHGSKLWQLTLLELWLQTHDIH
ncbi:asparagine synthase (glutamine-hydrolyzing) [Magnetococcus marinus MC-1]|uniref:asparagine synthase (glutamine-hydrolyzing) n=1 Tax=Magnetococcus marinus (strain ATCC BAA-1437 / JCM 17883 / MC-1) TaxID=156889 RepID=A0L450_MAGMM|nr:N-acetylglutaminylglutamine amidotransferase [Magnetococcus marinus]ABK42743.1 asparagine synthase (glutamine-hydrolyzing) [Magnetococcus marinus MC-1]